MNDVDGSLLRQARLRNHLSQTAAMRRFRQAVAELGETVPEGESLKRMFGYWENGGRSVTVPAYQRAFEQIYQSSGEELGFRRGDRVEDTLPVDVEELRDGLDRLLDRGTLSPARVDEWEQLAQYYGQASRTHPTKDLLRDLVEDMNPLWPAIERCHSALAMRRLSRVAAQMSGLVMLTLIKLDDRAKFRRWAHTARVVATDTGDPHVLAWVLAHEAHGHYYSGKLRQAVAVAQDAQVLGAGRVSVGMPLAAALEARASARMELGAEARTAIKRAAEWLARLEPTDKVVSALGYDEAQWSFHAGNTYTHLRDCKEANAAQDRALELSDPEDYTDRALIRLDRAACLANSQDTTGAVAEAIATITGLTASQRLGIIELRAREVVDLIPREAHGQPGVKALEELLSSRARKGRAP